MASKRRQRRNACGKKRAFDTIEEARGWANRLRRDFPGHVIDAYGCEHCGKFHAGHRPKKVRRSIAARRRHQDEKGVN